ncbi:MAG: hypothetical protein IJJ52_03115 [Lachnospiraceae bacterium]|nr:hypothetical protein [Lachnospiraceae bacterium]
MEYSDQNLLEELLKSQKKATLYARITAIAAAVLAAGVVIAILMTMPRVLRIMDHANRTLAQVETIASDAQESLKKADALVESAQESIENVEKLAVDADQVLEDNAEALSRTMENFNSVDFEALNTSIGNLEAVSERLKKVTSIFGG